MKHLVMNCNCAIEDVFPGEVPLLRNSAETTDPCVEKGRHIIYQFVVFIVCKCEVTKLICPITINSPCH